MWENTDQENSKIKMIFKKCLIINKLLYQQIISPAVFNVDVEAALQHRVVQCSNPSSEF